MTSLRFLVVIASVALLGLAGYGIFWSIGQEDFGQYGVMGCVAVIIVAIVSLLGTQNTKRQTLVRLSAIHVNRLFLVVVAVGGLAWAAWEYFRLEADVDRLKLLGIAFVIATAPFIVNSYALHAIARKVKRPA